MTAKEYLGQVRVLQESMKSIVRQIETLDDLLLNVSPKLSDMPSAKSASVHRMAELVATKLDLETKLALASVKFAGITKTINSLLDTQFIAILTSRYFTRLDWREIADELHISQSHLYRLHKDALTEVEKLIANESK